MKPFRTRPCRLLCLFHASDFPIRSSRVNNTVETNVISLNGTRIRHNPTVSRPNLTRLRSSSRTGVSRFFFDRVPGQIGFRSARSRYVSPSSIFRRAFITFIPRVLSDFSRHLLHAALSPVSVFIARKRRVCARHRI